MQKRSLCRTSLGKLRAKTSLEARAWDISQHHHRNSPQIGGGPGDTPTEWRPRYRSFSMGGLSGK